MQLHFPNLMQTALAVIFVKTAQSNMSNLRKYLVKHKIYLKANKVLCSSSSKS